MASTPFPWQDPDRPARVLLSRRVLIPSHPLRSSLALGGTALIWGFAFVAQRVGLGHLGAFTFNGLRFALGAVSLLPLMVFIKPSTLSSSQASWRATVVPGVLAGIVLFIATSLQQLGLIWTSAGKAAFLTGFYILLVPLFGLLLRRKPHPGVWWGAGVALIGLYLLSVTEAFTIGVGDVLQIVGALFWAVHILLIDRFSPRVDPLKLSALQFSVCSLLSLTVAVPLESFTLEGLSSGLVPLLYAGIGSVGIAYTLQVVGQRGIAPGPAALIMSLETVFAAVGGGLLLGETLSLRELVGCAFMLLGMVMAQLWPARFSSSAQMR